MARQANVRRGAGRRFASDAAHVISVSEAEVGLARTTQCRPRSGPTLHAV